MLLFCISIGAVPFSKLSCVSMCTFVHAHTYTPHTSTIIHLQLQSHVYCLCKFVFPCSGNYQQVFLLPFALLNISMHMHTHTHMDTNPQAHARTFMYTHRTHASITTMCICTHKNGFGSHPSHTHMHPHTHTQNWPLLCLISLLSLVVMSTRSRCEPALQECTLMHTGMHAQTHTHTLTQTNKQTNKQKNKHTHTHTITQVQTTHSPFCLVHSHLYLHH